MIRKLGCKEVKVVSTKIAMNNTNLSDMSNYASKEIKHISTLRHKDGFCHMLKCTIHNFRRISLLEKDILRGTSLPVTSYRSILGELATQRSKCSTNHRRPNHPGCCKNSPSSQSNPPLLCSVREREKLRVKRLIESF